MDVHFWFSGFHSQLRFPFVPGTFAPVQVLQLENVGQSPLEHVDENP
jgi:hypothetical protein